MRVLWSPVPKTLAVRVIIKKILFLVVTIALLIITGCTTPKAVMESWVGKHESDLISNWGAPDSMLQLKDGTKVYTWRRVWSDNSGIHQGRQSFTIDAEGKVIKWSYENMPVILRNW